jgi:tetratricopeptide (TPR) repeat protein
MKRIQHFIWVMVVVVGAGLLAGVAWGTESEKLFQEGIKNYNEGRYAEAVRLFSGLAEKGVENGKLYYNLGNAYLKNNDLGFAVLWYERAAKLIPDDPDLNFNLEYARSLVKDMKEERGAPVFRILFFWEHLLSEEAIKYTAIILNSVFFITALAGLVLRRRISKMVYGLILAASLVFTTTAFYNFYDQKYYHRAVIVSEKASVRSGLSDDATELFVLHAGAKVDVEKEQNGFYRIYFSKGKIGWLHKDLVEKI